MEGSRLIVTITAACGNRPETRWELAVAGDKLTGSQKQGDAETAQIAGVRAPELKRAAPQPGP